jgi:hypothetical protein
MSIKTLVIALCVSFGFAGCALEEEMSEHCDRCDEEGEEREDGFLSASFCFAAHEDEPKRWAEPGTVVELLDRDTRELVASAIIGGDDYDEEDPPPISVLDARFRVPGATAYILRVQDGDEWIDQAVRNRKLRDALVVVVEGDFVGLEYEIRRTADGTKYIERL